MEKLWAALITGVVIGLELGISYLANKVHSLTVRIETLESEIYLTTEYPIPDGMYGGCEVTGCRIIVHHKPWETPTPPDWIKEDVVTD